MQTTKNLMLRSSLTVLAAGLALSGCGDSHGAQQAQMGPTPVGVITVQAQSVTMNTELSGRTSAFTMAEVRPQVSGIILKRLFTEGGQVRAGQAL
jgi:membrane fusion protein (multidrug efflux system)